jgi:uncharacterized protein (TIGR02145 family)
MADVYPKDPSTVVFGGRTYRTGVMPDGRRWLLENLNCIPSDNPPYADAAGCYNNNPANCAAYGRLYSWPAAMAAAETIEGWHIPTEAEWDALLNAAVSDAGLKLKSTQDWADIAGGADGNGIDAYGFGALPGGYYIAAVADDPSQGGEFTRLHEYGMWWMSTLEDFQGTDTAKLLWLSNDSNSYIKSALWINSGRWLSVRLIQDASPSVERPDNTKVLLEHIRDGRNGFFKTGILNEWFPERQYPKGYYVYSTLEHKFYESLVDRNYGAVPHKNPDKWRYVDERDAEDGLGGESGELTVYLTRGDVELRPRFLSFANKEPPCTQPQITSMILSTDFEQVLDGYGQVQYDRDTMDSNVTLTWESDGTVTAANLKIGYASDWILNDNAVICKDLDVFGSNSITLPINECAVWDRGYLLRGTACFALRLFSPCGEAEGSARISLSNRYLSEP